VEPKRGLSVRLANLHWIDAFAARERGIDDVVRSVRPSSAGSPPQAPRPVESDEAKAKSTPPPKATAASTVALPWTPVKTLQGARVLTLVGASWLALMAFGAVAVAAGFAVEGRVNWERAAILNLVVAVLFGACAVGTYFNWRVAPLVGFALLFVILAAATLVASTGAISAPVLLILWLLSMPATAGILGTFATAGLLRTGEGHGQGDAA